MGAHKPSQQPAQYAANLALAGTAGTSGCVTLVVVIGALLTGLWLDNQFHTKPTFTLGCIVGSVPISLFLMMRLVLRSVETIQRRQYGRSSGPDTRDPK